MQLKHFTLLAKEHYQWPKANKDQHANMWEYVKLALHGDDYQPETKNDVLNILSGIMYEYIGYTKRDLLCKLINETTPKNCHSIGYYTKDFFLARGYVKRIKYEHETAMLYFFIHHARFMTRDQFITLPRANPDVLQLRIVKEHKPIKTKK